MLPRYVNIAVFGFLLHQSIAFARPHGNLYSRSQGVDRNSIEPLQVRNNFMLTPNAPVTIRNRDNIPRTADSADPRYQNFKRHIQNDLQQSIDNWLRAWGLMDGVSLYDLFTLHFLTNFL